MNRHEIDVIESAVTVPAVLSLHGVKCSGTRCRCPIHKGKRLSFSITDKLFHCFTCGASGGVIQLEAQLSGISENDACQVLAHQFGLDISKRKLTHEEVLDLQLDRKVEQDYKDYQKQKKNYYTRMSTLYRNISDVPELSALASDLNEWLDENIDGVSQPWKYQISQ